MKNIKSLDFKKNFQNKLEFEIVPFSELDVLLKSVKGHNPYSPNQITFNVMIIITDGKKGKHEVDFIQYEYDINSVFIIAKDQVHSFIDLPNHNEGYLVMFTEDMFLDISRQFPYIIDYFLCNRLYNPLHVIPKEYFKDIKLLAEKMYQNANNQDDYINKEILKSYFKILLFKIFYSKNQNNEIAQKDQSTKYLILFQNILKQYYVDEKSVKFYAEKMGISKKKLNEISKKSVNKTAKEFIISFIILEAKKLLLDTELSSKEISFKLGFEEPTNFTKFFKAHTGIKPTSFFKSHH